jgi:hypothetical protein
MKSFVDRQPGGSMILLGAGRDAANLYESLAMQRRSKTERKTDKLSVHS